MIIWNDIALIEDDTHFTKWVKEAKRLDHHQSFLNTLAPYIHGTVLDIGANIGTHTLYYANRAEKVIALEPNPEAFRCLTYNLRKHKNTTLYNVAASNRYGWTSLDSSDKNYGAAFTKDGNDILTISIDSLSLASCHFIKLDVEGDELIALEGAKQTIRELRPVICVECNEHTLNRKGYTGNDLIIALTDMGYNVPNRTDLICCDLLCLPAPT